MRHCRKGLDTTAVGLMAQVPIFSKAVTINTFEKTLKFYYIVISKEDRETDQISQFIVLSTENAQEHFRFVEIILFKLINKIWDTLLISNFLTQKLNSSRSGPHLAAQADLKFEVLLLPQPPKCWVYGEPPDPASLGYFIGSRDLTTGLSPTYHLSQ
jgi:hypothetical protein